MTATTVEEVPKNDQRSDNAWIDNALSEDMAKPTPVQQFIAAILHGNTIETATQYRGLKYGKPDTDKAA